MARTNIAEWARTQEEEQAEADNLARYGRSPALERFAIAQELGVRLAPALAAAVAVHKERESAARRAIAKGQTMREPVDTRGYGGRSVAHVLGPLPAEPIPAPPTAEEGATMRAEVEADYRRYLGLARIPEEDADEWRPRFRLALLTEGDRAAGALFDDWNGTHAENLRREHARDQLAVSLGIRERGPGAPPRVAPGMPLPPAGAFLSWSAEVDRARNRVPDTYTPRATTQEPEHRNGKHGKSPVHTGKHAEVAMLRAAARVAAGAEEDEPR
jgi:hypothetical protein